MYSIRTSLIYFLIFTVFSSYVAYRLVVKAYANYADLEAIDMTLDSQSR